jgi:hypothetical protein
MSSSSSSRQQNTLYWVLTLRACPFCTAKSKSYIQLKTEWTYFKICYWINIYSQISFIYLLFIIYHVLMHYKLDKYHCRFLLLQSNWNIIVEFCSFRVNDILFILKLQNSIMAFYLFLNYRILKWYIAYSETTEFYNDISFTLKIQNSTVVSE